MEALADLGATEEIVGMTVARGRQVPQDLLEGPRDLRGPLGDQRDLQETPDRLEQLGQLETQALPELLEQPGRRGLERLEQLGRPEPRAAVVFSACSLASQLERATAGLPIMRLRSLSRRRRGQGVFRSLKMVPTRGPVCAWTARLLPSLLAATA